MLPQLPQLAGVSIPNKSTQARSVDHQRCLRAERTAMFTGARVELPMCIVNLADVCTGTSPDTGLETELGFTLTTQQLFWALGSSCHIGRVVRSPLCASGLSLIISCVLVWMRRRRVALSFLLSEGTCTYNVAVGLRCTEILHLLFINWHGPRGLQVL